MLAGLIAVCLLGVSDGEAHHQRGHQNYNFENWVCSNENLPIEPESCGKAKDWLEGKRSLFDILKPMSPEDLQRELDARARVREFVDLCCLEA